MVPNGKGKDVLAHPVRAYGGTRIALPIHNLGAGWKWVANKLMNERWFRRHGLVSGQGLFRDAVLCLHSFGGTDRRRDESLASLCLGHTFYQICDKEPHEFHFDYTCAFRNAGCRLLRERGWVADSILIRSYQSNFVGVTLSLIVFRATVVQKLSNLRTVPEQYGSNLCYSFCVLYIHIFENLFPIFFFA